MIIQVQASRNYSVVIGRGLISALGRKIAALCPDAKKIVLVSDSQVWPLYGEMALASLERAGLNGIPWVFPQGEASKNGQSYLELLGFLAREQVTRSDMLVALGGGVTGDLTGFAAATYLRGVDYIQIPTSLLAAVDSAVGGKTAIDLPEGKNLVGAFWQPRLVLCDLDTLATLPPEIFRDGCAEVIKYGVLFDRELFSHLQQYGLDFHREFVIGRCIQLKRDVVAGDEFDTGMRKLLNLGHTMGHGVEAVSGYGISHGKAVALGMAAITRSAQAQGLCAGEDGEAILSLLEKFGLPCRIPYSPEVLLPAILGDKKRSGDAISLIVPRKIGECQIQTVPVDALLHWIQAGV